MKALFVVSLVGIIVGVIFLYLFAIGHIDLIIESAKISTLPMGITLIALSSIGLAFWYKHR